MKKVKVFILIVFMILSIVAMGNISYAGISMSASQVSISLGESKSVTLAGNDVTGTINVSSSNTNVATVSATNWIENNSIPISITGKSQGTAVITVSGTVADSATGKESEYTRTINVTVTGNSSGSSGNSSNGSTSGTVSSNNSTKKSSNANLSNLGIRPNDFSGFKPGTTTYNVTVPEDVESVEVYATAQDSGATISGTGTKKLQKGANVLNVVVTAEDGKTKTYIINATREGGDETKEEQSEENVEEVKNGLSNISIANLELSPSFDANVYEYIVKYVGEDTSLDIQTVATDPNYIVEVLGNEKLKEGENIITILVSDSEGNNVATYQVTVNKILVDEEALAREEEEKQKEEQRKMFMIAGGVIALIIIIVIVIIVKRRRNRAYAEEFSGAPFAGINDDDYNGYGNNSNYYDDYDNDDNRKLENNLSSEENKQNKENKINLDTGGNKDNIKVLDNENNKKDIKPQVENLNTKIDNSKEKEEKERAKREFLRGYDSADDDYFGEEKTIRGRKKGKRFK